jgi:GTP cyclohydrolase III
VFPVRLSFLTKAADRPKDAAAIASNALDEARAVQSALVGPLQ